MRRGGIRAALIPPHGASPPCVLTELLLTMPGFGQSPPNIRNLSNVCRHIGTLFRISSALSATFSTIPSYIRIAALHDLIYSICFLHLLCTLALQPPTRVFSAHNKGPSSEWRHIGSCKTTSS